MGLFYRLVWPLIIAVSLVVVGIRTLFGVKSRHSRIRADILEYHEAEVRAWAETNGLPKPTHNATLVMLGAYVGHTISSVAIGSDDVETYVSQIGIEPGTQPLFIVATSYCSMIWMLDGDVDRVEGFIVIAYETIPGTTTPSVGVIGLPKDRVVLPESTTALRYNHAPETKEYLNRELIGAFGRPADKIVLIHTLAKVALPTGTIVSDASFPSIKQPPTTGPAAAVWEEFSHRGGRVAQIDALKVVSAVPARDYQVLPQEAGLTQLLEEGALEPAGWTRIRQNTGGLTFEGNARIIDWRGAEIQFDRENIVPSDYRIARKMRFPAGLFGGHKVSFILGKGVPYPDGDPGRSSVTSEETGQPVPNPADAGRTDRNLRSIRMYRDI